MGWLIKKPTTFTWLFGCWLYQKAYNLHVVVWLCGLSISLQPSCGCWLYQKAYNLHVVVRLGGLINKPTTFMWLFRPRRENFRGGEVMNYPRRPGWIFKMIIEISPTPRRGRISFVLTQERHPLFVNGLDAVTAFTSSISSTFRKRFFVRY